MLLFSNGDLIKRFSVIAEMCFTIKPLTTKYNFGLLMLCWTIFTILLCMSVRKICMSLNYQVHTDRKIKGHAVNGIS